MERIIDPIDRELLEAELTEDKFVRYTNKLNNKIYIFTHDQAPNLMKEVGRLREVAFRETGGGTGLEADIDRYDTAETPYKQLILWNPDDREIVGGYRFMVGSDFMYNDDDYPLVATSRLLHFSEKFIKKYIPYTIELGRSFIQPKYQSKGQGALFALDNLWDGLGSLVVDYPECKYFFGKVTMYPSYNRLARNCILRFLHKYFGDKEDLIKPYEPLHIELSQEDFDKVFTGSDYKEDYKILHKLAKENGENIPPLVNAYMNLSNSMKVFGTAVNHNFGDVEETGILITIEDMFGQKLGRHVKDYKSETWSNWLTRKIFSHNL